MLASATRKLRQLTRDPVLRRYLIGRALGRWPALPAPAMAALPYGGEAPTRAEATLVDWPELEGGDTAGLPLPLPGARPEAAPCLFHQPYCDGETLSGLHRFAWVPLLGETVSGGDVQNLWDAWRQDFATPDDGPAWEAYSAAERAINLLDLGRRRGLPGPVGETVALLAAHAPAMAARLEYFGEHATHNHLLNNGRGLYRLGCDLGMEDWAAYGAGILRGESKRLFLASGILREGSTHYQLLYIRNLADCWLAALRAGRTTEAEEWRALLIRLYSVLPHLMLPGGLPLMGDISPDSPPDFLAGLLPGGDAAKGWTGLLPAAERQVIVALRDGVRPVDAALLAADGWLRADQGGWSGLWHADPLGWSFSPGHGHQDMGAPELHCGNEPIFIDPGRGAYGEDGEAALFRSGAVHGGLQVDGVDPYAVNKPYYDDRFRREMGGPPPRLTAENGDIRLTFDGFSRLGNVGNVERIWRFAGTGLVVDDKVQGRGRHRVTRRLVTPYPARMDGDAVMIETPSRRFVVRGEGLSVRSGKRWLAYGLSAPAWIIEAELTVPLPWQGRLSVEEA